MGISKSIDADEQLRKEMEARREEIRKEFETDLARNVSSFWQEKERNTEEKVKEIEDHEKSQNEAEKETKKNAGTFNPWFNQL
jgi:hypothetical protein